MAFVYLTHGRKEQCCLPSICGDSARFSLSAHQEENESRPLLWLFVLLAAVPLIITNWAASYKPLISCISSALVYDISCGTGTIETYDGLITEKAL